MDKQEYREKKNEKKFIVVLFILIALVIIIFLFVKNIEFIEHRPRIPTGNVDIFDIIFTKDCDNSCDCNNNCDNCNSGTGGNSSNNTGGNSNASGGNNSNNSVSNNGNNNSNNSVNSSKPSGNTNNGSNDNNNQNTPPIQEEPTIPEEKDGVEVFDREVEYSQSTQLRIFTNTTYYVVEDRIAPASENSYQFVIRNNNEFDIVYDLDLLEENDYNINMKYRLKLNGAYVAGSDNEWLTYDELKQANIGLAANTYDVYTLDWKWFESSNDTEVGTNINSNYKLELKITASEY